MKFAAAAARLKNPAATAIASSRPSKAGASRPLCAGDCASGLPVTPGPGCTCSIACIPIRLLPAHELHWRWRRCESPIRRHAHSTLQVQGNGGREGKELYRGTGSTSVQEGRQVFVKTQVSALFACALNAPRAARLQAGCPAAPAGAITSGYYWSRPGRAMAGTG